MVKLIQLNKRISQALSNLLKFILSIGNSILCFSILIAIKWVFKSKAVCNFELIPTNNSWSAQLILLYLKSAPFVIKHFTSSSKNSRKKSNLCPTQKSTVRSIKITIHERVSFSWMPMKITKEENFSFFLNVLDHLLQSKDCGMKYSIWVYPHSIEVNSCYRWSIIPKNYSIWILDRYQLEYEKFS